MKITVRKVDAAITLIAAVAAVLFAPAVGSANTHSLAGPAVIHCVADESIPYGYRCWFE